MPSPMYFEDLDYVVDILGVQMLNLSALGNNIKSLSQQQV